MTHPPTTPYVTGQRPVPIAPLPSPVPTRVTLVPSAWRTALAIFAVVVGAMHMFTCGVFLYVTFSMIYQLHQLQEQVGQWGIGG